MRLHEYFSQEGRNETLRADIPKGSYALEFEQSRPEAPVIVEPRLIPEVTIDVPKPRRIAFRDSLLWIAVGAAAICGFGWFHAAQAVRLSGAPWPLNAVIQPSRQTTVVVSDANLSALRFMSPNEVSLDQYLRPDFRYSLTPSHSEDNVGRMFTYLSHSELTSYADGAVVTALSKAAGTDSQQIILTSARDLDRRNLESGNYIFVGSAISNPWVSLFTDKLNFQMVEEGIGGRMYFRNRSPQPGEETEYEGLTGTGSAGDDFATISLLPGGMKQGNVLILQGLRQEGTEALGVLLADPTNRADLERAVRKNGNNSPYFEALVRARAVAGAPVSIAIVAARAIPTGKFPQH
jgi:hypothetical protein